MTAITQLGADVTSRDQAVHHLLMAYGNSGDVNGALSALSKHELQGHLPTVAMRNSILSAIVKAPDLQHGEVLNNYWDHYSADTDKFTADKRTYSLALSACEKYGRVDDAVTWFDHLVSSGLKVTTNALDTLHRTVGDTAFEECKSRLPSDVRQVVRSVDERQHRHVAVVDSDMDMEPYAVIPTSHLCREKSPLAQYTSLKHDRSKTDDKSSRGRSQLDASSRRGDTVASEAIFARMKKGGNSLTVNHYNHLLHAYSICKDPVNAMRVAYECEDAGIKLNLKSMTLLSEAYGRALDCSGAERILQATLEAGLKPSEYLNQFSYI